MKQTRTTKSARDGGVFVFVAMLGDGHSRLSLPIDRGEAQGRAHTETPAPADRDLLFRRYPVAFYSFSDGLFIPGRTERSLIPSWV